MLDFNSSSLKHKKTSRTDRKYKEYVRQNRLNVTLPAQACSNEICYQMEMLRNAAEIVGRFCAKLNAFRCAY